MEWVRRPLYGGTRQVIISMYHSIWLCCTSVLVDLLFGNEHMSLIRSSQTAGVVHRTSHRWIQRDGNGGGSSAPRERDTCTLSTH